MSSEPTKAKVNAEELTQLGDALRRAAHEPHLQSAQAVISRRNGEDRPAYLAKASAILEQRRHRAECFAGAAGLFQNPAWDILLHLFIAHEEGQPQNVEAAALASGVAPSVGQRWLRAMEQAGLSTCTPDSDTDGIVSAELTPSAISMMHIYLDGLDEFIGEQDSSVP